MEALTGLLLTLVALLWTFPPGSLGEKCTSFRHLENGRTFFRYRGLYVTFACNPGYKMHGYRTNSCVSGQWSREPPVCVASGCPDPGNIQHGVTIVIELGSWVLFSCDTGYSIHGPSLLYCKGQNWNSSKPVCKQSDIMSGWQLPEPAASMLRIQKQNRYAPSTMKKNLQTHQETITNTAFREAFLNPVLLANTKPKDIHTQNDPQALDPMSHLMEELLLDNRVLTGREGAPPNPSRVKVSTSSATTETFTSRSILAVSTDEEYGHQGTTVGQTELMDIFHRKEVPTGVTHTDPGWGITEPADVRNILSFQPHPQTHYEPESTSQVSKGPIISNVSPTRVNPGMVSPTVSAQSSRSLLPKLLHTRTESALLSTPVSPQNPVFSSSTNNINTTDHGVNIRYIDNTSSNIINTSSTTKTTRNDVNASATNIKTINNCVNATNITRTSNSQSNISSSANTSYNGFNTSPTNNINTSYNGFNTSSTNTSYNGFNTSSTNINTSYNGFSTSSSTSYNGFNTSSSTSYKGVNITVQDNGTYLSGRSHDQMNTTLSLPEDDLTHSEIEEQATVRDTNDSDRSRAKETGLQSVGNISGTPLHNITSPYMAVSSKSGRLIVSGDTDYLPRLVSLKQRPVCPYPPLPVHGTFYFRTVENPRPLDYKHYIQYACYAGYTLAHGNPHSYCLQGGRWSGVTPVCLEVTPCTLNNGGCSQLCTVNQNQAQCHCRPGFFLLEDQQTCTDVDECVWGQHRCHQTCVNTLGSFQCSCSYGYTLAGDGKTCVARCPAGYRQHPLNPPPGKHPSTRVPGTSTGEECVDINECDQTGVDVPARCDWKCVNLPGSYRCICPRGYQLNVGHQCRDINECSRENGGCSHVCLNQKGSYKCACPVSHRFSPYSRNKCLPRKELDTNLGGGDIGNH